MGTSLEESQSANITHDDKDLVQLAGYHAYKKYEQDDYIYINSKVFQVEEIETDPSTGLDALVVRNITPLTEDGVMNFDGELIIVYVGSVPSQIRKDWIETNINLIGDADPAQLRSSNVIFRRC